MSASNSKSSHDLLPCYQIVLGDSSRIFPISDVFVIGRGKLCDMRLIAFDVSRTHCEIRCTEDRWKITNKSFHGLSLNGRLLKDSDTTFLSNSDILILGSVYIQISIEVDEERFRLPVRTMRFNILVGANLCSLNMGTGNWETGMANPEANPENKKDENVNSVCESCDTKPGAKENLKRTTAIQAAGKVDLDVMDELMNVKQQNKILAKELGETCTAYHRVVKERDEAVSELEVIKKGLSETVEELLETELQCSICHEVVVNATTSNCSHTFCEYCFLKWTKKNKACPVCRSSISKHVRTKMIDNYVEKLVTRFPEEYQERRKEIVESRKELTQALTENPRPRKRRKRSITAASHNGRQEITITLQNLGSLMDTTIDISSDDDSPVFVFQQRV